MVYTADHSVNYVQTEWLLGWPFYYTLIIDADYNDFEPKDNTIRIMDRKMENTGLEPRW